MIIKDSKVYDIIKMIARYWLPALTTLYVALAKVWNLPYAMEISATSSAIVVCLNTLLGISNENYNKETDKYEVK